MRNFAQAVIVALMLVSMAGIAAAQQLPKSPDAEPPFGAPGTLPDCTESYRASLDAQQKVIESLRGLPTESLGGFCSAIKRAKQITELLGTIIGDDENRIREAVEGQLRDIGETFGVKNLDFRLAAQMCMQLVGESERSLTDQLGKIKSEQRRCSGV